LYIAKYKKTKEKKETEVKYNRKSINKMDLHYTKFQENNEMIEVKSIRISVGGRNHHPNDTLNIAASAAVTTGHWIFFPSNCSFCRLI